MPATSLLPSMERPGPAAGTLLDVVMVPDFRPGGAAAAFEARTLFFLASWLERAGSRARSAFHLHLACVGEPPRSVRRLAERCGAGISLHAPLRANDGWTANKLRGLETPPHSPRLLLLDSDLLVLNDLGGLADAVPADAFATAPACCRQVPDDYWELIYDTLGLPRPVERILSIRGEQALNPAQPMYPYSNSGVLLLPRTAELREVWEQDLGRVCDLFQGRVTRGTAANDAVLVGDQVGLATALHRLQLAGQPFCRLPEAFHYRPSHFRGGSLPLDEVRLFHAIHFLRGLRARDADAIEAAMENYLRQWTSDIRAGWRRRGPVRYFWRGWSDARQAAEFLRGLWRRHVRPALAV